MTEHITGQQARELLDGITGGQWFCYHDVDAEEGEPVSTLQTEYPDSDIAPVADGDGIRNPADGRLLAHAPALAETVAWLYGAVCHVDDFGWLRWPLGGSWAVGLRHGHISIGPDGGGLGFRAPEDAEAAARALLAAAEEARRHTD